MGLKITQQPLEEPVSLADAYLDLRIDATEPTGRPDDALIEAMISAARERCENFAGLSLAVKEYELALDAFPLDEIELPMAPVIEIVSVKYADAGLSEQTVGAANYVLDSHQQPAWLLPAIGYTWPATADVVNAVRIRYRAGYAPEGYDPYQAGEPERIPAVAKAAIRLMVQAQFHGEAGDNGKYWGAAQSLLRPLRVNLGMA